jgi:hypothetical protein
MRQGTLQAYMEGHNETPVQLIYDKQIFKKFLFYSYVHTLFVSFLPPSPCPSITPTMPSFTLP